MHERITLAVAVIIVSGCAPRILQTAAESALIRPLPEEIPGEFESEAGCTYTTEDLLGKGYVFGYNIGRSPWIGLTSGPKRLYVKAEEFPTALGEIGYLEYYGPQIEVRFDLKAPDSCPDPEEDCLNDAMTGTLTIRSGNKVERIRIFGSCGC